MKVIDCSSTEDRMRPSNPVNRWLLKLRFGSTWLRDMESQEAVITSLQKLLDNKYYMLRNVQLAGLEIPIPLILIGPPGVRILYTSASRGVFRAKGDVWEELDDYKQVFRQTRPNLMARASLMARAIDTHLVAKGVQSAPVEPTLFFTDPGTHVELVRPAVRIVLMDALERYVAGLVQGRAFLSQEDIEEIVNSFDCVKEVLERSRAVSLQHDAFSFTDEATSQRVSASFAQPTILDQAIEKLNKIPFSNRQWFLLIFMVIVNILLLAAFVVLILLTS